LSRLRLGTRGSALALAQARWVAERLGDVEIVEIATAGDVGAAYPASPVPGRLRRGAPAVDPGDKSRWTGALERALLAGEIDVAVHSAKDVPGELAPGTEIAAVPPRADARDVLVGAPELRALATGARVGTSSLRRRAQLLAVRPDLQVVELRGNVDTRLRKLAAGELDALVLAAAGLARLGRDDVIAAPLEGDVFVPAPGQGCLLVQGRAGDRLVPFDTTGGAAADQGTEGDPAERADPRGAAADQGTEGDPAERADPRGAAADSSTSTTSPLNAVDDASARALLGAERDLVARLDASCNTPVGAHAEATAEGIVLRAFVGLSDGSEWLIDEAADVESLAERLLSAGAADLLARAERMA
jgi:hydroxymethylbilane synthase